MYIAHMFVNSSIIIYMCVWSVSCAHICIILVIALVLHAKENKDVLIYETPTRKYKQT